MHHLSQRALLHSCQPVCIEAVQLLSTTMLCVHPPPEAVAATQAIEVMEGQEEQRDKIKAELDRRRYAPAHSHAGTRLLARLHSNSAPAQPAPGFSRACWHSGCLEPAAAGAQRQLMAAAQACLPALCLQSSPACSAAHTLPSSSLQGPNAHARSLAQCSPSSLCCCQLDKLCEAQL